MGCLSMHITCDSVIMKAVDNSKHVIRVRLQPEKCTRLSVIHAFQHSYHKTTRNIHVSLCIAVATIKYMDNPVP